MDSTVWDLKNLKKKKHEKWPLGKPGECGISKLHTDLWLYEAMWQLTRIYCKTGLFWKTLFSIER